MVLSEFFKPFHKSMKLGSLLQFGASDIVRHGAITKTPPGGHGGHFTICHYQIMYFASYLLNQT